MKNIQKIWTFLTIVVINFVVSPIVLTQTELSDFSSVLENPVSGKKVTLRGKIIEKIEGKSDYILTDGTNKIIIHLEDEQFSYDPNTVVEISGIVELEPHHLEEVEHEHASEDVEIIIKRLQVITANE